jgi:hypothetical protein
VARKRLRIEEEDATTQAGWLFADSFLALMIIFLATISFVPALTSGVVMGSGSVGKVAGSNYIKGLVLTYDSFNAAEIERDIRTFIENEKISPQSEVLYARIVGGYAASESEDAGKVRAIGISVQIRKSNISYFENASLDLSASDQLKPETFVLRLTFAPKGAN